MINAIDIKVGDWVEMVDDIMGKGATNEGHPPFNVRVGGRYQVLNVDLMGTRATISFKDDSGAARLRPLSCYRRVDGPAEEPQPAMRFAPGDMVRRVKNSTDIVTIGGDYIVLAVRKTAEAVHEEIRHETDWSSDDQKAMAWFDAPNYELVSRAPPPKPKPVEVVAGWGTWS